MIQEWTVTAPPDVAWTPDEFRQIGEALRALQSRLPGRYPRVTLDRILVVPRDEPGEAVEPDVTAQLIAGCSCGGPGCPPQQEAERARQRKAREGEGTSD